MADKPRVCAHWRFCLWRCWLWIWKWSSVCYEIPATGNHRAPPHARKNLREWGRDFSCWYRYVLIFFQSCKSKVFAHCVRQTGTVGRSSRFSCSLICEFEHGVVFATKFCDLPQVVCARRGWKTASSGNCRPRFFWRYDCYALCRFVFRFCKNFLQVVCWLYCISQDAYAPCTGNSPNPILCGVIGSYILTMCTFCVMFAFYFILIRFRANRNPQSIHFVASFLSFKASFLKEVSQKCFVFELQSFFFEGSLAEMLRFWASKLRFWRKSRTKASFLSFKASFLKEVSQKCFVFELQSFVFEGSLAQSFVFELQSFFFEGSLAEMLRFWSSKLRFWRKSRTKASFLSFKAKASFLKEVSQNSFSQSVSQSVSQSGSQLVRSISQSVSRSVSQSVSQIVSQWVSQSVSQIVSQSDSRSVSQPVSQSDSQSVSQSINQSVSQSVGQSVSQSVNQSINQSVGRSASQSVSQLVSRSVSQSVSQIVSQSVSQSVSQIVSQSDSQSVSQPVSQSDSQSVSQSINQSVGRSASQSVSQLVS